MPKIKAFTIERRNAVPPREWMQAAEAESHHRQADIAIFAPSKAAIATLLDERGAGEYAAQSLTRSARLSGGSAGIALGSRWQALIDGGFVDPTVPGVYLAYDHRHNDVVVRVDPDGCVPIVRWRAERRGGMTPVPYTPTPFARP